MQIIDEFHNACSADPPGFLDFVGGMLVSPKRTFERMGETPPVAAAVGLLILYLVATQGNSFLATFHAKVAPEDLFILIPRSVQFVFWFGLAFGFYFLFASLLFGEAVSFSKMFAIFTFSQTPAIFVLSSLVILRVFLHFELPHDITAPLTLLYKPENRIITFLALRADWLNLWSLIIIFHGLRGAMHFTHGKAMRAVLYVYVSYCSLGMAGMFVMALISRGYR